LIARLELSGPIIRAEISKGSPLEPVGARDRGRPVVGSNPVTFFYYINLKLCLLYLF
jgi:hypothetical protein